MSPVLLATSAESRMPLFTPDPRLLDALPLACAAFAPNGVLLRGNARFRDEFGPMVAQRSSFEAMFEPFVMDGIGQWPTMFCAGNGRSYEFRWSPIELEVGRVDFLTVLDLSDRVEQMRRHRTVQEQLLFTSRAMSVGEMVTTIAHELNQPLAAILNYLGAAQKLMEMPQGGPRLRDAIGFAREQAEHASGVIQRIREFVRTRQPQLEMLALPQVVARVQQLMQLESQKQRVKIEVALDTELPPVRADRVMIEQVLLNLIKNAIEAMRSTPPAQRHLKVTASLDAERRIEVRISDRGCGLQGVDEEQLFAPFFTTKSQGMGLGLAICRSIIEYHRGSLHAECNPQGGAIFVFALPAVAVE